MLDKKLVIEYIAHPDLLGTDDIPILEESLARYPFCHVSRVLYLKALYNTDSFSYPAQLARGAAFIADRKVLFELINRTEPAGSDARPIIAEANPIVSEPSEELSQWMDRENRNGKNTEELIDRFIRTNPRIKPSSDSESPGRDFSQPAQEILSEQVMTETLARIYVRQKKYDRAMEAYRILMLKNPKKSSFFADRIKELEKLRDKN